LNEKTHIDLFSGIGGFALAAGWAGFRTVAFCEIDPYCQAVLKARFGAITDAGGSGLEMGQRARTHKAGKTFPHEPTSERPSLFADIREFDGTRYRGATLLTGGFPCQPFSVAGKRKGKDDPRALWPEMLRVISEARPAWVIGENVAGIVNMELEQVCSDLEGEGYEVQPVVIPACALNAPHRRDRVWIIANHESVGHSRSGPERDGERRGRLGNENEPASPDDSRSRERRARLRIRPSGEAWNALWTEVAARLCRVDARVPRRVDRLKALGNSIVPQIAYEIIQSIAEIENE